jgi:transposase
MSEKVTLTMNEIKRVYAIQQIEEGKFTGPQAAQYLDLSLRQVRRLVARYRKQGATGLIHGNRGRPAHNRVQEAKRSKIEQLMEEQYQDYNDSHFTEELAEEHGLQISRSTLRRIRRAKGQKSPRKRRSSRYRRRRERKARAGMLLQGDGSRHDWLEGRGPWLTLVGYIDDATSEVCGASFRAEEDAAGYFLGLQAIGRERGIPAAVYVDQHTIFQSPAKPTLEQQLNDEQPKSQFGRLADELGIELIIAHSPQAKGRVERLWGTLQDRLVKALRKAGASNLAEANQVLADFLPKYNQRFQVAPAESGTAFRPWPKEYRSEDFFCFKHNRIVTNDNTLPFDGHRLQIPPGPGGRSYAKAKVEVRQQLDGRLEVCYQGQRLVTFQPVDERPVRIGKFSPAPQKPATSQAEVARTYALQATCRSPLAKTAVRKIEGEKGMTGPAGVKRKDELETLEKSPARLPFGVTPIILRRWHPSR